MGHESLVYSRLMATAEGDRFDRHVFACSIAAAVVDGLPLTDGLGLTSEDLAALFTRHFPRSSGLIRQAGLMTAPDQPEEPDLRRLMLDHRSRGTIEEAWLAHIIARRSQGANHLWQDMGLSNRGEISTLLDRHFHTLAAKNTGNMKWKKFFYRQLCHRADVTLCTSPNCEVCDDFTNCFGDELPVLAVAGFPRT
ncbi:MAG: nitrogen fixation protein NifQ [Alphaproteobacteria bacterium]